MPGEAWTSWDWPETGEAAAEAPPPGWPTAAAAALETAGWPLQWFTVAEEEEEVEERALEATERTEELREHT